MTSRIDQERVQQMLQRQGGNDRQIAELLGINPSTVWRLRNRRIFKVSKYLRLMSEKLEAPSPEGERAELQDLLTLADQSPALKAVLIALRDFLQEDAQEVAR